VQVLHERGYPQLAGLDDTAFAALVEPLRDRLPAAPVTSASNGCVPFLLVVRDSLVPTVAQVERWSVRGKPGWTDMAAELAGFRPIEGVDVPEGPVYLLLDVDTGAATLDVTPNDALPRITGAGRTPLTIDEGVALVTQHPDVFTTHNAFQALGSRATNKRVPSFWMSKGAPRLGWCWAGNPHSWLGSASAAGRG
jgi:Family of unknown function (DUF5701)